MAMRFVEDWLLRVKPDYLKICDPYFGPQDLELLRLIRKVVPNCHIDVLTSERKQRELGIDEPYKRAYKEHWSLRVSDQEPPDTDITIAGVIQTRKLGIHDRWWVTLGGGLAFGGSLNALGIGDTTRITALSADAALQLETEEIDPYLTWQRRIVDGQRVRYQKFSLAG
jgi:hypothetical protein